ncbi:MAG: YdcF family protein [Nodosilinea sp.]
MVDISACQVTAASHWASLSWRLFNLLIQPRLVLPFLTVLIAAPWVFRTCSWRRQASVAGVLLLLLYSLGFSPLGGKVGSQGLAWLVPADSGLPADAIVVLGRGGDFRPSRVQVAAELWRQQRSPLIFASGRGDAIEIGHMLEAAGIPAAAINGEPCSATINENALFTAALLPPDVRRLILVTDPPHMARSLLTFRSLGFEVIPHPSPVPDSLDFEHLQFLVLREWVGLIGYGMMGRYFVRETSDPGFRVQTSDGVMG